MSSTYKDKSGQLFSRVLPQFNGDIITSPRSQVYFLATEYGVINMEGRSTWERAEGLISIAHPDFRDELIKEAEKRNNDFIKYQVNSNLMKLAKDDAIFMHCLPAIRGKEVTSDVIDGEQSVIYDEAENRLHAQKAILYYYLKK